jgi:alanine racemase
MGFLLANCQVISSAVAQDPFHSSFSYGDPNELGHDKRIPPNNALNSVNLVRSMNQYRKERAGRGVNARQAWMSVDIATIQKNFKIYQRALKPTVCAAVLKSNAYGFGAAKIAPALYSVGARHFFVSTIPEAIEIAAAIANVPERDLVSAINDNANKRVPSYDKSGYNIFVLSRCSDDWLSMYKFKFIPSLNSLNEVHRYNEFAKSQKEVLPAVLHIDTGMNSYAVNPRDFSKFCTSHKNCEFKFIEWRYFMSHPVSMDPENYTSGVQRQRVLGIRGMFPNIPFSFASSYWTKYGLSTGRDWLFDMVRIGSGLYGIGECLDGVKFCAKLKVKILQIQDVPKDVPVGYESNYIPQHDMRIAIIACGYQQGLMHNGDVRIGRDTASIIDLCQNTAFVDVTHIKNVTTCDVASIEGEHLRTCAEMHCRSIETGIERVWIEDSFTRDESTETVSPPTTPSVHEK